GWLNYNGLTYYMNEDGETSSGVTKIDNIPYYFDSKTKGLVVGLKIFKGNDGLYCADKNGVLQVKMYELNGDYYYFDPDTYKAVKGINIIDGSQYYFDPVTYKRAKDVTEVDGKYYFYGIKYGKLMKGWVTYEGRTYYGDLNTGELYSGWHTVDGEKYFFGLKYKKLAKGWLTIPPENKRYYFDPDTGKIVNGWKVIDNSIYYFVDSLYLTGNHVIDGKNYTFQADGKMKSNFVTVNGSEYYFLDNGQKATGWVYVGGIKHYFNQNGELIGRDVKKVIDVSYYQPTIDWNKLVGVDQVDGIMTRALYRGYGTGKIVEDYTFADNVRNASQRGLSVGTYVFSQAITEEEAKEEANTVIAMVNAAGGKSKVNLPIVFDSEFSGCYENGQRCGRADSLSKAKRTSIAKAFLETVKKAGYTPMLYASTSFLNNNLDMNQLASYKIWVAQYNTTCTYNGPGTKVMWQYTSSGNLSAISGRVDLNVFWYNQY
ncbi:MAG: hypothetical protein E7160_03880, partial [Firmicutes bacterium]|nr:hypothetical protein [Bacillota bacterium]